MYLSSTKCSITIAERLAQDRIPVKIDLFRLIPLPVRIPVRIA